MDNSESWKALLRALDSMPQSTSSEISFPTTTKASGSQECVINFSMSPLSDEWKKSHVERSPNIGVFENLTFLPPMGEEEVTFGEKKTFVVGSEGGWRAINTVVELAGIELEEDEEADTWEEGGVEQEESVGDIAMEDTSLNAIDEGDCASSEESCSLEKGKRAADSQVPEKEPDQDSDLSRSAKHTSEPAMSTQSQDTVMEKTGGSASKDVISNPKRPKKKRRRVVNSKNYDEVLGHTSMSKLPTPTEPATVPSSSHLVEIARLCELMSRPTSTPSEHSSEADEACPDSSDAPKVRLVRRKANKLQCKRCLDLGTACDTQTPCSPCKRRNRSVHMCRPAEKDRDACREFALGKTGGVVKQVVVERKALFFDARGRFCKKDEAVKTFGEDGVAVSLEQDG